MRILLSRQFLAGLFLGALLAINPVHAVNPTSVGARELPAGIDFEGNLVAARRWEDGQGTNYILLTRTPDIREPGLSEWGGTMYSARLYGYHYRQQGGGFELLRRITDFVMECDADLTVAHIPDSLVITDLDADGHSEVTFLYEMNCTSDVSPLTLKLMMLEDGEKYPIRGTTIVGIGGGRQIGGEKRLGEEFASAPGALQDFASTHWDRFVDPGKR